MELLLIDNEYLSVKFQFNQALVDQIRALENRRWNPNKKQWEVHIVHLPELMKICYLHPNQIDEHILNLYRKQWIKTSLRVKVNHTYTTLSGTSIQFDKIDEVTSFWVTGSEYNPKYVDGIWDGRRHLFNKRTYQFPTGLLSHVLEVLKQSKTPYILEDERIQSESSLSLQMHEPGEMRYYQKNTIQKAVHAKRGIIEMATGSGKTLVAGGIILQLQRPTIFFVHTRELLYQSMRFFESMFGIPIGQLGDGKVDLQPITVATIQTTIRAFGGEYHQFDEEDEDDTTDISHQRDIIIAMVENYPVVFFDECHHLPSDTCYSIAMQTNHAEYRYGLSATPYRSDRQDMLIEAALGEKIVKINASLLIDEGYLVPPTITFLPVKANGTPHAQHQPQQHLQHHSHSPLQNRVKSQHHSQQQHHHDYAAIYQSAIVDNSVRNKLIAETARHLVHSGLTVLILVQQVRHGKILHQLLPESEFVQGADNTQKRNRVWKEFREQKLKLVIATTLADEGLDVPTLGALILAGGGKSETRALQRIGRVLRRSEHKEKAVIIDFIDLAPYLKEHSKNRWEIYQTEPRFKIQVNGKEELSELDLFHRPASDAASVSLQSHRVEKG